MGNNNNILMNLFSQMGTRPQARPALPSYGYQDPFAQYARPTYSRNNYGLSLPSWWAPQQQQPVRPMSRPSGGVNITGPSLNRSPILNLNFAFNNIFQALINGGTPPTTGGDDTVGGDDDNNAPPPVNTPTIQDVIDRIRTGEAFVVDFDDSSVANDAASFLGTNRGDPLGDLVGGRQYTVRYNTNGNRWTTTGLDESENRTRTLTYTSGRPENQSLNLWNLGLTFELGNNGDINVRRDGLGVVGHLRFND